MALPNYSERTNSIYGIDFEGVVRDQRAAPFTSDNFRSFLRQEYAEENLEFYEEVEAFREQGKEETESVGSQEKAKEMTEKYIKEAAEKQINIAGPLRTEIVQTVQTAPVVPKGIFDEAQGQVREMLVSGAFLRFIKQSLTKNITQEQGDWRKRIGIVLVVIGLLLEVTVFLLQILLPGSVMDSRYWRIVGLPFFVGACSYYVSGKKCLCSGLAAKGVYMRPGENRTWRDIFYQKNKDENKVIDDYAARKLAWEGRKLTLQSIFVGTVVTIILIVLPPGDDIYGSVL